MIRKQIENYVTNNYEKLLNASLSITKSKQNDEYKDLLNMVLLDIISREKYSDLVKNCNNYYNYIVRAMVQQYYSDTSKFYRTYKRKDFPLEEDKIEWLCELYEEEYDDKYDEVYESIFNYISNIDLYEDELKKAISNKPENKDKYINKYKRKNYIDKKLFFEYFFPEKTTNIKSLSKKETNELRKTSYRKIANKYNISHDTVGKSINNVINKIDISSIL